MTQRAIVTNHGSAAALSSQRLIYSNQTSHCRSARSTSVSHSHQPDHENQKRKERKMEHKHSNHTTSLIRAVREEVRATPTRPPGKDNTRNNPTKVRCNKHTPVMTTGRTMKHERFSHPERQRVKKRNPKAQARENKPQVLSGEETPKNRSFPSYLQKTNTNAKHCENTSHVFR